MSPLRSLARIIVLLIVLGALQAASWETLRGLTDAGRNLTNGGLL